MGAADESSDTSGSETGPTLSMTPEKKLRKLVDPMGLSVALMATDIQRLQIDSDLVVTLEESFASSRSEDLSLGFLFVSSILEMHRPSDFPASFFEKLVPRIRELISHESRLVRYRALEFFVWLRRNYADYREVMMTCLASDDTGCARIALNHYETYANPNEVSPLIQFCSNEVASEFAMNSPLVYDLRDLALQKISAAVGVEFCTKRIREPFDGTNVSWFDWAPFLNWWEHNKVAFI